MTEKRGPVVHWETEPPPESSDGGGMEQKQKQVRLRVASFPDSTTTTIPSRRTHEELNRYGSYHAKVRRYE